MKRDGHIHSLIVHTVQQIHLRNISKKQLQKDLRILRLQNMLHCRLALLTLHLTRIVV